MKRRSMLELAAGASLLGVSTLSGCVDDVSPTTSDTEGSRYEWNFPREGTIEAVVDGTVYVLISSGPENGGGLVALEAGTGTVEWQRETRSSLDSYTALTVQDGIYVVRCSDDDCTGLIALNMDGTERWTQQIHLGRHQSPPVVDDTVYVGTRDFDENARVQALNAASGEQRWEYQIPWQIPDYPEVIGVTDTVFVAAGSKVVALDRTDGNRRWEYETGDGDSTRDARVSDGIMYIDTSEGIAAISDGAQLWSRQGHSIAGITSDRILVSTAVSEGRSRLDAFDKATGEHSWTAEPRDVRAHSPEVSVFEDVVYVGTAELSALDANTGSEYWETAVDGHAQIETQAVLDESISTAHDAGANKATLTLFSPDGEQLWSRSIDNNEQTVYAVKEYVFVVKDAGIFALNPLDDSSDGPFVFTGT